MEKLSGREALTRMGHPAYNADAKRHAEVLTGLGIDFEQVKSGARVFTLVNPADVQAYIERERLRKAELKRTQEAEKRVADAAIKAIASPADITAVQKELSSLSEIVLESAANTETIMGSLTAIAQAIVSLRADMKRIADELVGPMTPTAPEGQMALPLRGAAKPGDKPAFDRGGANTAATASEPLKVDQWPDRPILSGPVRPDPIVGKR